MKTVYQPEDFESSGAPLSLTIGNFDGVHLGHQKILSQLQNQKVVLTFSNHPLEVLKQEPFYSLTTPLHRLYLFEKFGVDTTILLPFTEAFSRQTPEEFLLNLRAFVPFTHLVLGYDAVLGHNREGNSTLVKALAGKHGFSLNYLDPVSCDGEIVSSSAIRAHIQKGNFAQASALLGRPYSMMTKVEPGEQKGRLLGFQTANLKVHSLCLPPLGVYIVRVWLDEKLYYGVANLGNAPTLHANRPPILEVHIIDFDGELYQRTLEVEFLQFLRPEKKFASIEELKAQISQDVQSALAHSKKASDQF
ncbi:MAG: Bifunctional riboflavin kinase/FMN adenylyltransferase [Chlamydiales bacterium]|nr:Bifunctional riboflavin kinase/FMN adenylyltransferase [Chlamydiales bacterium]